MLLILGAKDMAAHWSDRAFDGFPVIPIPVNSDGRKGDVFKCLRNCKVHFIFVREHQTRRAP